MKKSIIGLVFGLIVGLALSASASSMLGKAIDAVYPLFIDGTRCSVDAISIEGTSYIPVRNAGEMFGYNVNFVDNVIILNKAISNIDATKSLSFEGDDIMESAENSSKFYCNDLTQFNKGGTFKYVVVNGEYYMSASAFRNYMTFYDNTVTINMPWGSKLTYAVKSQNEDKFILKSGTTVIRLSALGLKATSENGAFLLEKI